MRLQFLQAVHLKKAPGHVAKDYKVGVHVVPSAVLNVTDAGDGAITVRGNDGLRSNVRSGPSPEISRTAVMTRAP